MKVFYWELLLKKGKKYEVANNIRENLYSVFLPKPSFGVLDNFFPTGTFTGIGTSVSSLKHVMKRTTKKKICNSTQELVKLKLGDISGKKLSVMSD